MFSTANFVELHTNHTLSHYAKFRMGDQLCDRNSRRHQDTNLQSACATFHFSDFPVDSLFKITNFISFHYHVSMISMHESTSINHPMVFPAALKQPDEAWTISADIIKHSIIS